MERRINYLRALREALVQEMRNDPNVVVLGEDIRQSLRGITKGCLEEFGPERVWDTPISESAFVGLATGGAVAGLRPVVEFQIGTLIYVAFEQMVVDSVKHDLRNLCAGSVVEKRESRRAMQRREERANGLNRKIEIGLSAKLCMENVLRFGLQTLAPE